MYSYLPFSSLFSFFLFTSTMMIISSSNIIIMWAATELNLLSIIPLMTMSKTKLETEAAVKYFLAQALGSGLILISYITMFYSPESISSSSSSMIILILGMLTKLGATPMHFWFPSVMSSLPWPMCILLATWQKLAPLLMIMFFSTPSFNILIWASGLSALTGGIMGINQTQLPSLIAYSSIGHLGWILSTSSISASYSFTYFLIYSVTSGSLMILLHILNLYNIKQFPSFQTMTSKSSLSISILLLSLGGLPPLLGFAPKLMVMLTLIDHAHLAIIIPLIIGSTMNLSYYLVIVFNTLINSSAFSPFTFQQNQYISPSFIMLTTIPLSMMLFIIQ